MLSFSRLLLTVVLFVSSAGIAAGEGGQGAFDKARSLQAEFPPSDNIAYQLQQGLNSKRADRLLREDRFAVEAVQALVAANREEDALRAAQQIFDKHPERIAPVLDALAKIIPGARGDVPGREDRLQEVLAQARSRMAALDRPERAAAAYALYRAERFLIRSVARSRPADTEPLRKLVEEYAGTPAALEAEVDLIEQAFYADRDQGVKHQEELLAFARSHCGTVAGARALYSAAFHVANNADMIELSKRGGGDDPTGRFLILFDLVRELQGGGYPKCQATEDGDRLITGLYAYKAVYAPENVDKLLAAISRFVTTHWALDEVNYDRNGIGYLVANKVAEFYKIKGEGIAGFEQYLSDLERKVPDRFGVQYLRAQYYLTTMASERPAAKAIWLEKARQVLAAIQSQATGFYRRKALATLAALSFRQREFPAAREGFVRYLREYPESPYAWVAAIRIGQCDQLTGGWAAALAAYQNVPAGGDASPVPQVLAEVLAARAHEALGEPVKALDRFRQALERWDLAFGEYYDAGGPPETRPVSVPFDINPEFRVLAWILEARVAQLQRTTTAPGAVPLERARWLLRMQRWQEAVTSAEQVVAEFPKSPNSAEAGYLRHRAQLEDALERADVERPGADPKEAVAILERLSQEPLDSAVCVAGIARAYLASGAGASAEGEKLLLETLEKWRAQQGPAPSLSALEQDVANIRSLVFHPNGDSIYAGTRWNGFAWPPRPSPFVATASEVRVRLADGTVKQLSFTQRYPHLDNALPFDREQIGLLNTLMTRLGGTKAREGQIFFDKGYMEAPNQPIGPSLSVMAFLRKGIPVMPGHWGGWHFATFPTIDELLFLDDPRTRAVARIRVGYAGGDVLLEKQGGVWKAKTLTQTWVE